MPLVDQPFTLLYVSELAPSAPFDAVADIARLARVRNAREGVTGLLAFDGQSFAQFMQGSSDAVSGLWERLQADTRHRAIELLHLGPLMSERRFPSWRLGYLLLDEADRGIERLRGCRGAAALSLFETILPLLDVGMEEALPAA